VHKNVLAPLTSYKTIALTIVKPLHSTSWHEPLSLPV
jgi:hypothetical protein